MSGTLTAVDEAKRTERPASLADVRDLLLDEPGTLLFTGSGTKLDWGAPPDADVDLVVETSGLDRIRAYDAADATVSVEAGLPLHHLQEELADARQWLAIDPPLGDDGATVGGVFATNDYGPSRLSSGGMRDLVIGLTVLLADGSVGRSGGKVIKNVAGYDLGKLFCGSFGTLGLITELTLRVHPLPEASVTVTVPADADGATAATRALRASTVEPTAIDWAEDTLWIRLRGMRDAVRSQAEQVRTLLGERGANGAQTLSGDDEAAAWERLVEGLAGGQGETVLRAATLPNQTAKAAAALRDAATDAGAQAALHSHAAVGLHTARLYDGDVGAHAQALTSWRAALGELGGWTSVRRPLSGLSEHVDLWGPAPAAVGLMRRVKEQFDPQRRCAPGRFVGGI